MSRLRWVVLAGVGAAVLLVLGVVWWSARPTTAERYAGTIVVDGYRQTATEVASDLTVVTFWIGPASVAPDRVVKIPELAWTTKPYPPDYKYGNFDRIDSGVGSKWYGNIDNTGNLCSASLDRLVLKGRNIRPSEIERWNINASDAASIERGESSLLAVAVTCWESPPIKK